MKALLIYAKNKLALVAVITAAFVIGGITTNMVMAAIPDSSGVIHGCRTTATGAIKVIDSVSQSCNGLETTLNWDQTAGNSNLPFTCGGCNLTNYMGSRLAAKNLTNAYLGYANLEATDLSNSNLTNASFIVAGLPYSNLTNTNLTNVNLTGTNLSHATGLDTATLTGITWSNTTCPDGVNSDSNGGDCAGHLTP